MARRAGSIERHFPIHQIRYPGRGARPRRPGVAAPKSAEDFGRQSRRDEESSAPLD